MVIDGGLQVVLDEAAHHDDGLPGHEGEDALEEVGEEIEEGLQSSDEANGADDLLPAGQGADTGRVEGQPFREAGQGRGQGQGGVPEDLGRGGAFREWKQEPGVGLLQCIDPFADDHRGEDGERIGQEDEDEPEEEPSAVLPQIGVQCGECAHAGEIRT